ncbi:MAG TPA: UbiD family decarboxylase [Xanthobacteraceae bacterium]
MSGTRATKIDVEKFRLRRLVERLIELGEVDVRKEPVPLKDVSRLIEATDKAVLFKQAGPERHELVANIMGSRRRLAAAFGATEREVVETYLKRRKAPQPAVEIPSGEAPVHAVVVTGSDIDLTKLPFHLQHELDGGPYISAAIDFALDPDTGRSNVGARRLSLRNRTECGTNLFGPSHLREIYLRCVQRKQRLPIAFALGCHPSISMAAEERLPVDEIEIIGGLRGECLPVVKCISSDIRVPADAEMIIEGYLDERGYREPDGPYGEYMGYYGDMHIDPVFHCTAITMRADALHQTVLHGSTRAFAHSDTFHTSALQTEAVILDFLRVNRIGEPVAVHAVPGSAVSLHIRIAIRQRRPGDARAVISAVLGAIWWIKHLWVFDHDVDITDNAHAEWAFATRFQGDRDLVVLDKAWGLPADPSLDGRLLGTKLGFDCTVAFGRPKRITDLAPSAPVIEPGEAKFSTVRDALKDGPKYFVDLVRLLGSDDGRELTLALNALRDEGLLARNRQGQYLLHPSEQGKTTILD